MYIKHITFLLGLMNRKFNMSLLLLLINLMHPCGAKIFHKKNYNNKKNNKNLTPNFWIVYINCIALLAFEMLNELPHVVSFMQSNGQHLLILTQHRLHTAENSSIFSVSLSCCFSDVSVLSKHSLESFTIMVLMALGHRCIWDGECFNCRVSAAEEDICIKANRDKINGSPSLDLSNFSTTSPSTISLIKPFLFLCLQFPLWLSLYFPCFFFTFLCHVFILAIQTRA